MAPSWPSYWKPHGFVVDGVPMNVKKQAPPVRAEQPVVVAVAATPPASSALFMSQRRRSVSGVRGPCPRTCPKLQEVPEGNLKPVAPLAQVAQVEPVPSRPAGAALRHRQGQLGLAQLGQQLVLPREEFGEDTAGGPQ